MTMKNIFKKITAGVITLSVVMGMAVMPAGAEEAQDVKVVYDHEIQLLHKLGIATEDLTADLTADITRGEFSELLTALIGVGGGGNAIEELYNLGIVNGYGYGSLKEAQAITTYEAIKMIICALGYNVLAEGEGGYPLGYVQIAYETELIKGSITNSAVTVEQALRLIVDAGNTKMATKVDDITLGNGSLGGKTMFYTYFNVERYRGILTANGYTSIGGEHCMAGRVIIGGTVLDKGDTTADDLLGYNVEAYAYYDEMLGDIIVAAPRPLYNEVVQFSAGEYPEVTGTLQDFRVKGQLDDGTTKRVDFKGMPKVIRNGVYYGSFNLDVLRTVPADLTFINNDREGGFDVIKIDQYETYIIESVDAENEIIYGKYDGDVYTGSDPSMPHNYDKELAVNAEEENVFIYKTPERLGSFTDLVEGTAISVLESDDQSFKKIYILPDSVIGTIMGMSTSGMRQVVTIEDKDYFISEEYKNFSVADKVEPQVGIKIRAVLDLKGNIVDMTMAQDVWTYGYIMRMGYNRDMEMFSTIKIYNAAGKVEELTIGEKITIDGIRVANGTDEFVAAGIARVNGGLPQAKRQLVRFKSKDAALTHIDTTTYNSHVEDVESLQGGQSYSGKFSTQGICIYSGTDVLLSGTDQTSFIQIPTTAAYYTDERFYKVGKMSGIMSNGNNLTVYAYNVSPQGVAKFVVREMDAALNAERYTDVMFLKGIETVADSTGEAVKRVTAINLATGAEYVRNTVADNPQTNTANTVMEGAQFGDTFRFRDAGTSNGRGTVLWSAMKDLDRATLLTPRTSIQISTSNENSTVADSAGTYIAGYRTLSGYIKYADDNHVVLAVNSDGTGETSPFYVKGKKVYIADYEEETIEELPVSRIAAYTVDNMANVPAVIYQRGGNVYAMVICKNIY